MGQTISANSKERFAQELSPAKHPIKPYHYLLYGRNNIIEVDKAAFDEKIEELMAEQTLAMAEFATNAQKKLIPWMVEHNFVTMDENGEPKEVQPTPEMTDDLKTSLQSFIATSGVGLPPGKPEFDAKLFAWAQENGVIGIEDGNGGMTFGDDASGASLIGHDDGHGGMIYENEEKVDLRVKDLMSQLAGVVAQHDSIVDDSIVVKDSIVDETPSHSNSHSHSGSCSHSHSHNH